MIQVLSKIGKVLLVLGLIYFGLWALNQFGVLKTAILQTVSLLPGLYDLADNYELGSKRSTRLHLENQRLKEEWRKLNEERQKLAEAQDKFSREKNQWERDHPAETPKITVRQPGDRIVPGDINPPQTADAKIKEYLTLLGKMKPKQAALIIQKLPEETVFTIFEQLNQYQVIKIMENLPEDYLARLTQNRLDKYRNL